MRVYGKKKELLCVRGFSERGCDTPSFDPLQIECYIFRNFHIPRCSVPLYRPSASSASWPLPSQGQLVGYSYTIGQNSFVGTITISMVDKIKSKVGDKIPSLPKSKKRDVSSKSESEFDYARVRDQCFNSMFLKKSGYHFSQSRWGAEPVLYQFRGLELVGPKPVPVNDADAKNGIDRRIRFEFVLDSYRRFNKGKGWEAWQFQNPPSLSEISLLRQNGEWKVASAPTSSYSLR